MSNERPVIDAEGLTKRFGGFRALDGLDLQVTPGEVHGFLGPNGAGKSTTVRILLGMLRIDGGRISLFDRDPWRDAVPLHRRLAYVPGDVTLWPNLTGGEIIDTLLRLRGPVQRRQRDELIERFELDPRKKARSYSTGNRQKVALISALASPVDLLILDEPTSGLDPLMEAVFQQCIRESQGQGRTVLLSSHILAQVEALADRISIIRQGRTVESGSLDQIRQLSRTTVEVTTQEPIETALSALRSAGLAQNLRERRGRVIFEVDGDQVPHAMAVLGQLRIGSILAHPPTLEELLLRHYGDAPDDVVSTTDQDDDADPRGTGSGLP